MVLPPKCRPVHHAKGDASGSRVLLQAFRARADFSPEGIRPENPSKG